MKILFFILLLIVYDEGMAQEERPDFGEVTLADFSPTPFDSLASSVVLFDKEKFERNSPIPFIDHHIRVKIINKDAYAMWGDFKLGNAREKPYKIKTGIYYVENGKIVSHEVEKDAFLKDGKTRNQKTKTLTNLREGCIIELSFRIAYEYRSTPFWMIQREVPVLWSEYLLDAPGFSKYVLRGGFDPYISDINYKGRYHRWVFKNIPPFKAEPLMPDPVNYIAMIECWVPAWSWIRLRDNYLDDYARWYEYYKPKLLKSEIKHILDSIADPLQKVKSACSYIKENYPWTGDMNYKPGRSRVLEEKKGASGDLNIFLYSVLEVAGFKPAFVLLSTPDNGVIVKDVPSQSQFNYVLCSLKLDGKRYFLDVTNRHLPFNIVPSWCTNSEGFVVSKQDSSWIRIESEVRERNNVYAWLSVGENETLKGKVTSVKQGYDALDDNEIYEAEGELEFKKKSMPNNLWVLDSAEVKPLDTEKLQMTVTHFGSLPGYVIEGPGRLYVNPYVSFRDITNIFKDPKREFPVDFRYPFENKMIAIINIPDNYKIESLPKSQIISLPDKTVSCTFKAVGSGKNISVIFQITLQKTWFEPAEYGNLREFFNQIISMQEEMIVLTKI